MEMKLIKDELKKTNKLRSPRPGPAKINYTYYKVKTEKKSFEELGIIAVAGSGQDVVSDDVADGTPSEDVDDVEANWVV